jgi:hypothetical protein
LKTGYRKIELRAQGTGLRAQSSELRTQGSGLRTQSSVLEMCALREQSFCLGGSFILGAFHFGTAVVAFWLPSWLLGVFYALLRLSGAGLIATSLVFFK